MGFDRAPITLLLGRGDGTFLDGPVLDSQHSWGNVKLADLNEDGRDDVIASWPEEGAGPKLGYWLSEAP